MSKKILQTALALAAANLFAYKDIYMMQEQAENSARIYKHIEELEREHEELPSDFDE